MHMSDPLLSPVVGGVAWVVAAGVIAYAASETRRSMDARKPPLMGVLGAFVFAAQMVNFSIPGTGSSGHLGGGTLLSVLLGPAPAFLVMASVLTVQALLFADGGLLALGCNLVNLGLFTCFLAYPLVFRPLAGPNPTRARLTVASVVSALVGLVSGAFFVVCETTCSGISTLPFGSFLAFMLPIHAVIGLVEGLITAGVLAYVRQARPELLRAAAQEESLGSSLRPLVTGLALLALVIAGALSWFASRDPDGLEWAISRVTGQSELAAPKDAVHHHLGQLQKLTSRLPGYSFSSTESAHDGDLRSAPDGGTSLSGLIGALLTLALALSLGFVLKRVQSRGKRNAFPTAS